MSNDWRDELSRWAPEPLDPSFWDACLPEDEAPSVEESFRQNLVDACRDWGVPGPDDGTGTVET